MLRETKAARLTTAAAQRNAAHAHYTALREALHYIPQHDRDLWLRIGMAIKSELGDEGFDLWDEWSQQDESYNAKDARDVWKSIANRARGDRASRYRVPVGRQSASGGEGHARTVPGGGAGAVG